MAREKGTAQDQPEGDSPDHTGANDRQENAIVSMLGEFNASAKHNQQMTSLKYLYSVTQDDAKKEAIASAMEKLHASICADLLPAGLF